MRFTCCVAFCVFLNDDRLFPIGDINGDSSCRRGVTAELVRTHRATVIEARGGVLLEDLAALAGKLESRSHLLPVMLDIVRYRIR